MVSIGRKLKSKVAKLKTDLQAEARRADQKAGRAARSTKRKAKQDLRALDRRVSDPEKKKQLKQAAQRAAAATGAASDRFADTDLAIDDDVPDRARKVGEARAPIDATLDPMGDPRGIEAFATAAPGLADQQQETDERPPPLAAGISFGSGGGEGGGDFGLSAGFVMGGDGSDDDTSPFFGMGDGSQSDGMGWF